MSKGDILLLHGAFVGGWVFEKLRGELNRRGWKTHAPDLPFHGADFAGQLPHPDLHRQGVEDYRRFLESEIARLMQGGSQPPVLLGHSLGGLLAQQLAARNLARAAVLLAPVAPWGTLPHTMAEVEGALGLLWKTGNLRGKALPPDFELAAQYSMDRIPPALRRDIFTRLVPESGRVLFETLTWWLDWHAATQVSAHRVQIPLLVIAGSDDKVTPAPTCRAVAGQYPGRAVFREVPDLSHFIFGEPKEDEVNAMIADWIDGHAASA
ncbi:alpha/beta hydrolase [Ferrovibrio sp.]|uniref:alpha/beta hydrolase n=1 Tax=Ferrovibrio sp. TaxID=1917215 RepID=UPI00261DD212|nr:alpha/beta hydrolase [Ferrovibrio sp.]